MDVPRRGGGPTYDGGMAAPGTSSRPHRRTAAFFDLDKTIIAKSSTMAFSKPFQAGGLISRRAVLRSTYAQFVYVLGGADHDQMEKMRAFMSTLVAGWDVATVREIVADTLHNVVDPLVYDEAVGLIEEHKAAGRDIVIVSTSGTEVVEPIGAMLGADIVVASRLEVVDGKYTGEIEYYAYAEEKARAVVELAELRGYDLADCYAYSDSVTDVPDARGGRPRPRGQPGQGAPPGRDRQRVAGPGLHQAGRAAQPGAAPAREADHRGARGGWGAGGGWRAVGQRPEAAAGGLKSLGERLQICRWHPSSPGSRVPPLTRESWATRRATSNCCPGQFPVWQAPSSRG